MWVLTIGVLEVNPELDSICAQRGRAYFALEQFFLLSNTNLGLQEVTFQSNSVCPTDNGDVEATSRSLPPLQFRPR